MNLNDFISQNNASRKRIIFIQELIKMICYNNPPLLSKEQEGKIAIPVTAYI